MEVLLNATLAGGVAVGSASDLVVTAAISMLIGGVAGIVSALGFLRIGPWLQKSIGLHDTCGVHNLHGLPGVLGGCIGAISAATASSSFGNDNAAIAATFSAVADGRTLGEQGTYQFLALITTLAIAILGGLFSGFVASFCGPVPDSELFSDSYHFKEVEFPEEEMAIEMAKFSVNKAANQE